MNLRQLNLLVKTAMESDGVANGRVRMAAAVIQRRNIIALGSNQMKTHPLMMHSGYRSGQIYLHAEADAIRNSLRSITVNDLRECELAVIRIKRGGIGGPWQLGLAQPCPGCSNLIEHYGIKKVTWSTDSEHFCTNSLAVHENFGKKEVDLVSI